MPIHCPGFWRVRQTLSKGERRDCREHWNLVLQRRFKEVGAPGPFVTILRILEPPQQLIRPEPFPGQHLPHHPVDLRPRDPGHLFPQACCRLSRKAPPSRHRATWRCQPDQVRVSYSSSPTSLFSVSNSVSIRHREPPTYVRVSSGVSSGALDK